MATSSSTARTKQNILENLEKTFPPEVPVYLYCGHGEEVCDPETKEIVVARVPDNCIYITIAECGMDTVSTSTANVLKYNFIPDNSWITYFLDFPSQIYNKDVSINKIFSNLKTNLLLDFPIEPAVKDGVAAINIANLKFDYLIFTLFVY